MTGLPLTERKALLSRAVLAGDSLRLMEYVEADGESVRCRWLAGLEWKEASFRIDDLDVVAA